MWELLKLSGIILAMEVMVVGSNTLTKAATAKGMSNYVYITYTHAIALLILFPAAFLYHRKKTASTHSMLYDFPDIPSCHPQAISIGTLNILDTWICKMKGPVFIAMFKPLQMIIAVIMGAFFLGDVLHVGSVIGGLVIAVGFYTVVKGKAEEEIIKNDDESVVPSISNQEGCNLCYSSALMCVSYESSKVVIFIMKWHGFKCWHIAWSMMFISSTSPTVHVDESLRASFFEEGGNDPELILDQDLVQPNESNGSKSPNTRSKVKQNQVPLVHGLLLRGSKESNVPCMGFNIAPSLYKSCVTWMHDKELKENLLASEVNGELEYVEIDDAFDEWQMGTFGGVHEKSGQHQSGEASYSADCGQVTEGTVQQPQPDDSVGRLRGIEADRGQPAEATVQQPLGPFKDNLGVDSSEEELGHGKR
uniref:WAT1-related protein n=1 Tax=Chenopodium quinoa TaxID=63459 RepID=A0A803L0E7_CHEQI